MKEEFEEFKAALNSINVTEESPDFTSLESLTLNNKTILSRGKKNTYTLTSGNNTTRQVKDEEVKKLTESALDKLLKSHGIFNAEERKFMINALSKGSEQVNITLEEPKLHNDMLKYNNHLVTDPKEPMTLEMTLEKQEYSVYLDIDKDNNCTEITYIGGVPY